MSEKPRGEDKAPDLLAIFILDTSPGMYQYFGHSMSALDASKRVIKFLFTEKGHLFSKASDIQVVLVTFQEEPIYIQSRTIYDYGLKEFFKKLFKVEAKDTFNLKAALKAAYEYALLFRLRYGFEKLGEGRAPYSKTRSFTAFFTGYGPPLPLNDGDLNFRNEINGINVPGSNYYEGDFFADMRFSIFQLKWHNLEKGHYKECLEKFAIPRGGSVTTLSSMMDLKACLTSQIEQIKYEYRRTNKLLDHGLLVDFIDKDNPQDRKNCLQIIHFHRNNHIGQYPHPIPDDQWHDNMMPNWLVRKAIPTLTYEKKKMEAIAPDARYPYDSYVLPRSSLVEEFIDNTKLEDCWPIYVSGSSKYEDYPIIGYLSRMAPNYDSSKGGYQKFQFTKPQFKYEAFLIILGFNFKELFKVLSLVPRTNLYEPNRNAMKKWEEEARKFMVKCPSYYQQHYETILIYYFNIYLPSYTPVKPSETHLHIKLKEVTKRAIEEYYKRNEKITLRASEMIKPMPLSFIEDINKISREKILSSLYREKLLFKLAMSGAEAPIVGPEFPFIPNLISKFDESLAQFDEERVESQRLRNAIETEEQARKRKENAFGNLFRNKYTPVPDGNFAMGVRSINEIQEKKRKSVKIRRRSITSNSTQQLSFKLPKLFDVESLDLVSETEFGSEYSLDLETDGLASPSDKYLKNPEVPVLSPLITEEKLATLNESLEELIQVDENKLNEKDEIGNEDNKNNMDNLITLSTESKQEKYELKKENKNEDEKEDNIRGKKEDIKELKNEEIMETSRESTLEIPITQLKNQLHQMMVEDEDDNKILLQIENVLNNSNYTKMDKNLLKSNLVKQATRLKKKSLSLNIKNLKD